MAKIGQNDAPNSLHSKVTQPYSTTQYSSSTVQLQLQLHLQLRECCRVQSADSIAW